MRRTLRTTLLLGGAALALYGTGLGYAPIYLCDAEVLFAVNAHAIATTAHDLTGRLLPLYFHVYADMWFQPIIVYFTALFLTVLPLSEWAVRFPSAVVGTLDVVLMYLIARRLYARERLAVLAAVLLAITPAHFIHSRLAMDYLYPVPFILGWLLCLLIFLERRELRVLFAGTSLLGLGFYSYIASAMMMPVYLMLTWLAISGMRDLPRRAYLVAAAGFVWPLLILIPWLLRNTGAIAATAGRYELSNLPRLVRSLGSATTVGVQRASEARIATGASSVLEIMHNLRQSTRFSGLAGRMSLYWYFFDPSYLFLMGGYANVINSTHKVGVFLLPLAVWVPVGLNQIINVRRTRTNLVLALGFASAPLAACLVVPEPYAIDRELALVPFAILIAIVGIDCLSSARRRLWRVAGAALVALVPLHFAFFMVHYFTDYRTRSAVWFEWNRRGALEEIIARDSQEHLPAIYLSTDIPYIDAYWRLYAFKHGRPDLLGRTVYFDSRSLDVRAVPARSLLLTNRKDPPADALVNAGELRKVAMIPEPDDPPAFAILQR